MFSKVRLLTIIFVIVIVGNIIVNAQPGTNEDPIVSKSYVDAQISKIKEYIEKKVSEFNDEINNNSSNKEYKVVNIKKDEKIILSSSSEIILRGGIASIIDSNAGGIADLTIGVDLRYGYDVPANHLLLVPLSDGRGVLALEDCIFLIKGDYEITK